MKCIVLSDIHLGNSVLNFGIKMLACIARNNCFGMDSDRISENIDFIFEYFSLIQQRFLYEY